jgi:hypothetical protein
VFGPAPGKGFPSKVAFPISLAAEDTFLVRFGATTVLEAAQFQGMSPEEDSSKWYSVDCSGAGTHFFLWLKPIEDLGSMWLEILRLWFLECGEIDLVLGRGDGDLESSESEAAGLESEERVVAIGDVGTELRPLATPSAGALCASRTLRPQFGGGETATY